MMSNRHHSPAGALGAVWSRRIAARFKATVARWRRCWGVGAIDQSGPAAARRRKLIALRHAGRRPAEGRQPAPPAHACRCSVRRGTSLPLVPNSASQLATSTVLGRWPQVAEGAARPERLSECRCGSELSAPTCLRVRAALCVSEVEAVRPVIRRYIADAPTGCPLRSPPTARVLPIALPVGPAYHASRTLTVDTGRLIVAQIYRPAT